MNVVPGSGAEAGAALASHRDINQLTFTGSVEVGIAVAKMAADNVVPVVMELGGKSPNIVFADADLDVAVRERGQRDLPERRPDLLGGIASAHRAQGARRSSSIVWPRMPPRCASAPASSDPDMGPIISQRQLETIERYVAIGKDEGASVAAGGSRPPHLASSGGFYFQPTLLDRVTPDMRVAQEEIFGPVLAIIDVRRRRRSGGDREPQPVRPASPACGRATSTRRSRWPPRIKAGQVYVNTYGAGGGVELPFGGYKKSGYGREKGLEALASYTQVKNVCIRYA